MWGSIFGDGDEKKEEEKGPMEQLLDFIEKLGALETTAPQMESLVTSLEKLGSMTDSLAGASEGLYNLGGALASFGMGLAMMANAGQKQESVFGSLWGSLFGGDEKKEEQKGPMEQLLDFIGQLSTLETTAPQMESLVTSLEKLGGMTDSLVGAADGLYTLGGALASFGSGLGKVFGAGKKQKGLFGSLWAKIFGEEGR